MTYNGLSMNTILPTMDMWQYSMLPLGTVPSVAYPQDSLSSLNDQNLFKFNCYAGNVLNQTAMTNQFVDNWAQQFNARLTQWYQNMMSNLSFNTNISGWPGFPGMPSITGGCNCGHAGRSGRAGGAEGVDKKKDEMDDLTVWKYMARLGSVDTYGEKFKEKVKLKDGTETTYVDRLTQLCKDYVADNELGLTESEFAACKEAAVKMKKSGKIDKSDYQALKAIVDAHLSNKKKDGDGADDSEGVVRDGEYANWHYTQDATIADIAELYGGAVRGAGTDKDELQQATESVNKYNVIEVLDKFDRLNAYHTGEDWITAIMDEGNDWNGKQGGAWYCFGMDDDTMRPFVNVLAEAMYARVKDIRRLPNCDQETKDNLSEYEKELKTYIQSLDDSVTGNDNLSDGQKREIIKKFNALRKAIKETEENLYVEI